MSDEPYIRCCHTLGVACGACLLISIKACSVNQMAEVPLVFLAGVRRRIRRPHGLSTEVMPDMASFVANRQVYHITSAHGALGSVGSLQRPEGLLGGHRVGECRKVCQGVRRGGATGDTVTI